MSAAASPPPAALPDAGPPAGGAIRVLLFLAGFTVLLGAISHVALVHSGRFLAFARGGDDAAGQPMRIEATLRALRPGEARIIAVGSSVLFADVDAGRLAERYDLDLLPLSLFGGSSVELAMLSPRLAAARPGAVVFLATVWTFFDHVDWPGLRVYDPRIAASLASGREIVADRQAHASHLLGSLHFLIRHRAALRARMAETTGLRLRTGENFAEEVAARLPPPAARAHREATAADFSCTGVNARALELMARRMREAGITFVLVPTPADSRWDRDETVWLRLDGCLAEIAARTGARLVLRSAPNDFPPSNFENEEHMNAVGRQRFTDRLGLLLQHALAPRSGDAVQ
jgi:hypothetical protein